MIFSIFPGENYIDLTLYQFGWEKCDPGHSFGPAKRNHYLFHYILSGSGMLMANDSHGNTQTYHIKNGQGFLIFPGQLTTYISDSDLPWEYAWLEFDGLHVKEALNMSMLTLDTPVYHSNNAELKNAMVNEMLYIVNNSEQSSLHLMGHLYLFLDNLLQSCKRIGKIHSNKMSEYYIKEAIVYIEQNFHNNISIEGISQVIGINRSYFSKLFKQIIGKSPQEFLINYRMIKATELLRTTQLSVSDIGKSIGYENALHFSRAFKNIYGVSPLNWRKLI